ncbi:endonuclease/exonuclease/phosphatase family protein [Oxalobacter vibrioformis]|uniref:Endonuclease/exonuclease/phosphatase family protein n=1 Tax=Oxalobacter vibrioformis TaxID=933080 RepID=A0A9E9LWD0_9BURK|nr:endonuclease/exonuclease/phosphatase family protein [Oxalobacter vibrioformis]WAW10970.1 endonuclease/exonuclease/phosphatase family protein [Oxalobacter vibrioformis]
MYRIFNPKSALFRHPMTPDTLKLITWNIRWGRGLDNIVDLDRVLTHVKQFSDFDILCLQEIASGYTDPELKQADGSNQFDLLAEKLPEYTPISGHAVEQMADGRWCRFGNMIFSRFPVLQVYRHRLPWPAEPDVKSMPRMALEVLLDTPFGILSTITTHLEFYSAFQRMAQVDYLREIHQETWGHAGLKNKIHSASPFSPYPEIAGTILAGDFNFSEAAAERIRLLSPFDAAVPAFTDTWDIANPNTKHAPTMGVFDRKRWPDGPFVSDYIFVSENLAGHVRKVSVEEKSLASDHQALLLELAR